LATIASRFNAVFSALNTPYPERKASSPRASFAEIVSLSERIDNWLDAKRSHRNRQSFLALYEGLLAEIQAKVPEQTSAALTANRFFSNKLTEIKGQLRKSSHHSFDEHALANAFALIAMAVFAVTGLTLRRTQILAARSMLQGHLAEMATGEGKTYAALLASAVAGFAGIPVHLMTSNEYLAVRDAQASAPIFHLLGIRCGAIVQAMERDERRRVYCNDVVYCTASEVIFDYLRDRLEGADSSILKKRLDRVTTGSNHTAPVLRGLCFALVDEADSILIDDASTPFILASSTTKSETTPTFPLALDIAAKLHQTTHYRLFKGRKQVELTLEGKKQVDHFCETLPGLFSSNARYRTELVELALAAQHCFVRDVDYVIADGEIHIVDSNTGRVAVGRQWSRGLHQLIEAKESVSQTDGQKTMIQLTYQRFFPRYLMLAGMSGTLFESARELRLTYGLSIDRIAPFVPSQRQSDKVQLFFEQSMMDRSLLQLILTNHRRGQPILLGTDSVDESVRVSRLLTKHKIPHSLLNAQAHEKEAAIIEKAGQMGAITVATNIAGRGTDIALGEGVKALGGLLVVSCQCNGSRRIDRQLSGRSGRRGDPGSAKSLLNVQHGLLGQVIPRKVWALLRVAENNEGALPGWLGELILRRYQSFYEAKAMRQRRSMMSNDEAIERRLSFGGLKD
jgi:preprotein translocase subunit SecA